MIDLLDFLAPAYPFDATGLTVVVATPTHLQIIALAPMIEPRAVIVRLL